MFRLAGRLSWWWKEAGRQIGRDRLTARSILLKTTVLSDGGCTSAPLSATDYSLFLSSSSSSKRNRSKIEGSEDGPPRSVVEGVVSLGKGYQWIGFSRFGKALEGGEAWYRSFETRELCSPEKLLLHTCPLGKRETTASKRASRFEDFKKLTQIPPAKLLRGFFPSL